LPGDGEAIALDSSSPRITGDDETTLIHSRGDLEMGECVVIATQQTQVRDDSLATIGPGDDVVGVTPAWRSFAAMPGASAVASYDGPSQRGGDNSCLSTDVENLGFGPEHDAGHRSVADQRAQGVGIHDDTALGLMETPHV
jgi:hypothetical protein